MKSLRPIITRLCVAALASAALCTSAAAQVYIDGTPARSSSGVQWLPRGSARMAAATAPAVDEPALTDYRTAAPRVAYQQPPTRRASSYAAPTFRQTAAAETVPAGPHGHARSHRPGQSGHGTARSRTGTDPRPVGLDSPTGLRHLRRKRRRRFDRLRRLRRRVRPLRQSLRWYRSLSLLRRLRRLAVPRHGPLRRSARLQRPGRPGPERQLRLH